MVRLFKLACALVLLSNILTVLCADVENKTTQASGSEAAQLTSDSGGEHVKPSSVNGKQDTIGQSDVEEGMPVTSNCTTENNGTSCVSHEGQGVTGYLHKIVSDNKDMLLRTFYVMIGITGIIIVYFIVRVVRTHHRQSRTKRYGLLSNRDDHLEMAPLDADDDEEDMTLFDVNQTK